MPRKFLKRIMPSPQTIRENKTLHVFGDWLHDPDLWHLNRRSVATAFAIGLFFAWMPVPFQMIFSAAFAIYFRANLPISIVLVWITNPVTIPPMFYFAYLVGTWIIGSPPQDFSFEPTLNWLMHELESSWQPFLVGCFTVASVSSLLGYVFINTLWRYSVMRRRATAVHKRK